MPVPATTGQLRTKISDMQIGDYIPVYIGNDGSGNPAFYNLGHVYSGQPEVPITGFTTTTFGAYTYLIKCARGLLISDRVIWVNVSWDKLNSLKYIQGKTVTLADENGLGVSYDFIIRSLTGGVAYADANRNKSTTDQGYGGWPVNNEWDRFIVGFPQELIQPGKTLDDVFHWDAGVSTWCQDTPAPNVKGTDGSNTSNTFRCRRGKANGLNVPTIYRVGFMASNISETITGFRPVFEYIES